MTLWERMGLMALRSFDPETAHGLALKALNAGLAPQPGAITSPRLEIELAGMTLPNPVGLAAGFDKNAVALGPLSQSGFGFLEVGATTPRPQPGNPRPRLFRLKQDQAAINRFGFNNEGADAMAAALATRPRNLPIGLNLGANKDSADRTQDFASVLETCGSALDFATINVSSPNTEALRDLQGKDALRAIIEHVLEARPEGLPIFVKIAPDLDRAELEDIAAIARELPIAGLVATNTTLSREGLESRHKGEAGGLSGAPLFARSTEVLAHLYQLTEGQVPLIGVGGVASAQDALEKIQAGATAVQFYTAMVYQGIGLAARIPSELDTLLCDAGYTNASQAIGTKAADYPL
ncbi:quinone-dependent dihydroorotate dehydrogenase [Alphaproteobacteria bacterium KMM 3653]|uniref:Dihydroorotate dehydrogenase (quinone) n=1 Tax=Harenicola maris TaxID=2841044 RepID=A0AAP2G4S3_9RHOB|nr:quinone-dependent dihydroorotate dehydrogenase [Harenicola maris]